MKEALLPTERLARSVRILTWCVVLLLILQGISLSLQIRREVLARGAYPESCRGNWQSG